MKWYFWLLIAAVVGLAIYFLVFKKPSTATTSTLASAENAASNAGFNPYYIKDIAV